MPTNPNVFANQFRDIVETQKRIEELRAEAVRLSNRVNEILGTITKDRRSTDLPTSFVIQTDSGFYSVHCPDGWNSDSQLEDLEILPQPFVDAVQNRPAIPK